MSQKLTFIGNKTSKRERYINKEKLQHQADGQCLKAFTLGLSFAFLKMHFLANYRMKYAYRQSFASKVVCCGRVLQREIVHRARRTCRTVRRSECTGRATSFSYIIHGIVVHEVVDLYHICYKQQIIICNINRGYVNVKNDYVIM